MDPIVLHDIPVKFDLDRLAKRLHLRPGSRTLDEFAGLVAQAEEIARPKTVFRIAYVTGRDTESVEIDGILFESRVLRVNMKVAHRVFVFVATCGTELNGWAESVEDELQQFWAETLKEAALRRAMRRLGEHIVAHYRPGKMITMNPGSLMDWPIRQQRPLFQLLGDPLGTIGVQLTASCLMVPNKSVSGLRFATRESFESCQLCPRRECPGRRSPYDATLYEKEYAQG